MKLSDKPCYPTLEYSSDRYAEGESNGKCYYSEGGLTFRERLIIALASNPRITFESIGDMGILSTPSTAYGEGNLFPSKTADRIITHADEIIKELEK